MKTAPLTEVATIERRGVDPASLPSDTRYLGLEHIERGGRIIGSDTVGRAELASTKFAFTPDHVLYGKLRPNLGKVTRPTFAGVCSTDILPIRPGPKLDRDYLAHYLSQPAVIDFAASRTSGANLPRISPTVLGTFAIPLPPLDEQRRIANILDRTADLQANRRRVLEHHQDLPQAVFKELFGQWNGPVVTIADVALPEKGSIRTGPFGSQLLHSEFVDQGIAVLGLDNVVGNEFTWGERRYITAEKYEALRRYTVLPGDVLMSIMGTCGRCVVVPDDIETAINTKHICAITVNPRIALPAFVRAAFLWHPASRQFLARMTKGSVMDGLNMGIIKATPIPLPDLQSQQAFVDRAKAIDQGIRLAIELKSKTDEVFASVQTRAFQGEL